MVREKRVSKIQLKVAEAKQRDIGKGRARLDIDTMNSLKIIAGDVVELKGKGSSAATAWPLDPVDQKQGILRIDGQTRKNAGIRLNDFISVNKENAKSARSVTLAPVGARLTVDKDFSDFVKNRIKDFPITEKDDISVVVLGNPIIFNISQVKPKGIVKVEQNSRIIILAEPIAERKVSSTITYDEIGGLKDEIGRLREIVELPLRHPEIFQRLGIEAPSGILLHGPPGCGKTLLAKALANECEARFFSVNGPEIMNKYYGETESKLREIFKEASENAPSIIFIDEIDAVAPKREDVFGDVEKRVVAQILALMDGLSDRGDVVVMGATNRPEGVDPALRRPGRFDREAEIGVPNIESRLEILRIHTRGMPLSKEVSLKEMAKLVHGYTGADLRALCRESALKALRRYIPDIDIENEIIAPEVLDKLNVTSEDFLEAVKDIVPTALREFYVETPSVSWSDIGGLDDLKKKLNDNVIRSIKNPELFRKAGVKPARGVLLYGPSGCGKTLLARSIATESGANFITVRGPEVLSKWVGESEKAIREVFRKAKASAPCIVFFDEIDSISKFRSNGTEDDGVGERVLSQLLTEIDSIYNAGDIFVVAATNRPDLLDLSLIRPGRIDLTIFVAPPDEQSREAILRVITKKMPLANNILLSDIAHKSDGYSSADLESLCRETAISALNRTAKKLIIMNQDFDFAFRNVKPSINADIISWYESIYEKMYNHLPTRTKNVYS
ncbi:MAG: CDC48 family AAA ATPase [Nitrososphaerales archaeon]|jgi:transitional endoplasmic reticulum ATPase|nr:CDC48 family AAA ATPase [Nitrososphaerales archaeon]